MLNELETRIIGLMLRTPFDNFTIYQLAKQLKKRYSYVYRCVKSLKNRKIIKINKIGNANHCRIDFETAGLDDMTVASIENKKEFLKKNINIKVIENSLEKYDSVIVISNKAMEIFEDRAIFYLFNGIALLQTGDNGGAVKILESGVKYAENDEEKMQFYNFLAEAYKNLKDFKKSDSSFEKVLEINLKI